MERRNCKLCFKSFSNGRALGGHMRSHMATLQPSPSSPPPSSKINQLRDQTESNRSFSSSSSSSSSEEELELDTESGYGLRENPKKSIRLVDPEFSFTLDTTTAANSSSLIIQDRESETESSKNPSRIRRSKRNRNLKSRSSSIYHHHHEKHFQSELKKPKSKFSTKTKLLSVVEQSEPVSSISYTSPEEDVALCLMLLSKGSWNTKEEDIEIEEQEEEDEEEDQSEDDEIKMKLSTQANRNRGKYQCDTCNKIFRSYQALGGHRASHKKIKTYSNNNSVSLSKKNTHIRNEVEEQLAEERNGDKKIHQCQVCLRVFGSGQALGGHKRSHMSGGSLVSSTNLNHRSSNSTHFGDNLIDLNLPAPVDDEDEDEDEDDISQIELSAVSDAEFFNPIK